LEKNDKIIDLEHKIKLAKINNPIIESEINISIKNYKIKIKDLEQALILRDKIDKIKDKNSTKDRQRDLCKIIIEQENIIKDLNNKINNNNTTQINSKMSNSDQIINIQNKLNKQYHEFNSERLELLDKNNELNNKIEELTMKMTEISTKLIDCEYHNKINTLKDCTPRTQNAGLIVKIGD